MKTYRNFNISVEQVVYKKCWIMLDLKKAITPKAEENISVAKQDKSKLIVNIHY